MTTGTGHCTDVIFVQSPAVKCEKDAICSQLMKTYGNEDAADADAVRQRLPTGHFSPPNKTDLAF